MGVGRVCWPAGRPSTAAAVPYLCRNVLERGGTDDTSPFRRCPSNGSATPFRAGGFPTDRTRETTHNRMVVGSNPERDQHRCPSCLSTPTRPTASLGPRPKSVSRMCPETRRNSAGTGRQNGHEAPEALKAGEPRRIGLTPGRPAQTVCPFLRRPVMHCGSARSGRAQPSLATRAKSAVRRQPKEMRTSRPCVMLRPNAA